MNLSDRILRLRKEKGLSQEELADKIGVSRQAVSKWESGQSVPDIEKIILLSDYFQTTTDHLLKGTEQPAEAKKWNAAVFTIIASFINIVGLIAAIMIWIERRRTYSVGIGLAVMALGCSIYLAGQSIDAVDQKKAKILFAAVNVWTLLLIPLSCCFNICDGILGGFYGRLSPIPHLGNSYITYFLCWLLYLVIGISVDVIMVKKINAR